MTDNQLLYDLLLFTLHLHLNHSFVAIYINSSAMYLTIWLFYLYYLLSHSFSFGRNVRFCRNRSLFKNLRLSIQDDSTASPEITQSRQKYGIPTYDALFKYVLDEPSIQPSFFHALAGLDVTTATRIDEHLNPLQELEHLRKLINDDKTIKAVSSLRSKNGISVSYQGKNGELVHKGFTKFVEAILPHFDDLRRAFPKPRYDGTMDFVCKLSNGDYAMVEMQVIPYDFWDCLLYTSPSPRD